MTIPSSMAASRFKYNALQLRQGEFSLAQWLWYWFINQAALVRVPPGSYISAMHLLISFFVTDFVRKMGARPGLAVELLIPFIVQKMDFLPYRLSVINK